MKLEEALPLLRFGRRIRRKAWNAREGFGLGAYRSGGRTIVALGYGGFNERTNLWKSSAIDVLADDWEEVPLPPMRHPHETADESNGHDAS